MFGCWGRSLDRFRSVILSAVHTLLSLPVCFGLAWLLGCLVAASVVPSAKSAKSAKSAESVCFGHARLKRCDNEREENVSCLSVGLKR